MSQALLKQGLGDAGAEVDASHSASVLPTKLYDLMKALCLPKPMLSVHFAGTVVTGVLARLPITKPDCLRELVVRLDICGSAGATTVQVRVNGSLVANGALTIDNAAADPTQSKITLGAGGPNGGAGVDVKDGDIVDINVSVAPTAGSGLSATIYGGPVGIE